MPSSPPSTLSLRCRADLYTQLAALENAGLPAAQAFAMLKLSREAQPRLEQAQKRLAQRGDIAVAGESSGLFTKRDARLIKAALIAGSPGGMYRRLADVYTQRAAQAAAVKARLILPGFMLLAALFIGPLPGLVTGAIGLGGYVLNIVRPLLLIAALFFIGRALLPKLPLLRTLHVARNHRDFFESLALMLEAGVAMLDALPAAVATIDDAAIRRAFAGIAPQIARGATLAQALATLPLPDDLHLLSFVQTGESSGTLPEMLFRHIAIETTAINDAYEQLAVWAPRLIYAIVAMWIAYGLINGPGIGPRA